MPNHSPFNPSKYHSFEDIKKQSPFWQRLQAQSADAEVRQLQSAIEAVATEAFAIAKQIVAWMPTYTLHDERHLLNLIAWMEQLTPEATLAKMTPLEIGLCFLAVFTHDLGMALPADERRNIETKETSQRQALDRHAERFPELVRRRDHLQQAKPELARHIDDFLLCDYLRSTHATTSGERINVWLDSMKKNGVVFEYNRVDYQHELKLIAASHNQPVGWLRHELGKAGASFYRLVRTSEWVNFALPGLLLRLADIMDFDRSRTPAILYQHLGLDDTIGIDWKITHQEWSKHLAVTGIDFVSEDRLMYVAGSCPSPVMEKCIRQFVGWIRDEVLGVREELRQQAIDILRQREKSYDFTLALPNKVEAQVEAKRENGKPIYTYHDLQFQLDHDEIMQLLMGEKLYGDPGLCIRELLQNALDAVELREKRLQLSDKGGQPSEPVDGDWLEPGFFKHKGPKQRFEVKLFWGHDTSSGQEWICVEDNGVGMTLEVLKSFFTRIGKSYYRSGVFQLEQNRMREHGLLFSPIAQFGIGFLSCFMLADRVEVRTHPGGSRPAHDVILSGPGSLFWIKPGTRGVQGTEVKLFLKRKFKIQHEPDKWLDELRVEFGYLSGQDITRREETNPCSIDPAFLAARHVVWPRYPLILPDLQGMLIDDRFHLEKLTPIEVDQVCARAKAWGYSRDQIGEPSWDHWDWQDDQHKDATGTRIRLWFPCNHQGPLLSDPPVDSGLIPQSLLASFVETRSGPAYSESMRSHLLVHGMDVGHVGACEKAMIVAAHIGSHVWIDLRDAAAPQLLANRRQAQPPEDNSAWLAIIRGIFNRWQKAVRASLTGDAARCNLFSAYVPVCNQIAEDSFVPSFPQTVLMRLPSNHADFHWSYVQYVKDRVLARDLPNDLDRDFFDSGHDTDFARHLESFLQFARDGQLAHVLADNPGLARQFASDYDRGFTLELAYIAALHHGLDAAADPEFTKIETIQANMAKGDIFAPSHSSRREADGAHYRIFNSLSSSLKIAFLQEAFFPGLRSSWPWLGLFPLQGMVGQGSLHGPTILDFIFERDGRTVRDEDKEGTPSLRIRELGYDLVFPLSVVPLGNLRRQCEAWRVSREPRRLGVLPFLVPSMSQFSEADRQKLREYFRVDRIYALLPHVELWEKRFVDWTPDNWNDPENLSALWDLQQGSVLWARGTVDLDWIRKEGLPPEEFLKDNQRLETTS